MKHHVPKAVGRSSGHNSPHSTNADILQSTSVHRNSQCRMIHYCGAGHVGMYVARTWPGGGGVEVPGNPTYDPFLIRRQKCCAAELLVEADRRETCSRINKSATM